MRLFWYICSAQLFLEFNKRITIFEEMSALSNEDYHLARIRQKLKDDGVKLWEAPYYVDNQTNESLFQVSFYYFQLLNRNIILKIIVSSGIGFQFF